MGNMREISIEECRRVSGGRDIVVIGSRQPPSSDGEIVVTGSKTLFGNMYGNYTDNPYYKAAMAGNYGAPAITSSSAYGPGAGGGGAPAPEYIYDPVRDGPPGVPVDEDGDGEFDVIVTTGAKSVDYFDLGLSRWIMAGLTFSSKDFGIYFGVGAPGVHIGHGESTTGELPLGWELDSTSALYRSGALPIAGYDKVYYDENGKPYMEGDVYDPIAEEYVSQEEWQERAKEYFRYPVDIRHG